MATFSAGAPRPGAPAHRRREVGKKAATLPFAACLSANRRKNRGEVIQRELARPHRKVEGPMGERSDITIREQNLTLYPEKAAFWKERKTLLVADPHWGKSEVFQRHGIPVPSTILQEDLARLSGCLEKTQAERLVLLGDFIHAKEALVDSVVDSITKWRQSFFGEVIVIQGNHERGLKTLPSEWRFEYFQRELSDGPFAFRHEPGVVDQKFTWVGHVHPMIQLRGHGDKVRLPCFVINEEMGILPSFGTFTRGQNISVQPHTRVFVVGEEKIFEV